MGISLISSEWVSSAMGTASSTAYPCLDRGITSLWNMRMSYGWWPVVMCRTDVGWCESCIMLEPVASSEPNYPPTQPLQIGVRTPSRFLCPSRYCRNNGEFQISFSVVLCMSPTMSPSGIPVCRCDSSHSGTVPL